MNNKQLSFRLTDENTVRINEAVEVRINGDGTLSVVMLKTPTSGWATNKGQRPLGGDVGVNIPVPGVRQDYTQQSTQSVMMPKVKQMNDWEPDPYHYLGRSSRGLTVRTSTNKAADHIYYEVWEDFDDLESGDITKIQKVVRQIIVNGRGRHKVYQLAGRVKNFAKHGWNAQEKPLINLFQALALEEGLLDAKVI